MDSFRIYCRNGIKCHNKCCSYNHPNRPFCRNGDSCTREDCFYNHKNLLCQFGSQCTSELCRFRHPGRVACRNGDSCTRKDCFYYHKVPLCRFESNCLNEQCKFRHPLANKKPITRITCRNWDSCTRKDCYYNHDMPLCQFESNCMNELCKFRHPLANESYSDRTAYKKVDLHVQTVYYDKNPICKFGANCSIKQCMFRHPSTDECLQDDQLTTFPQESKNVESQVLNEHKEQIKLVNKEMESVKSNMSLDRNHVTSNRVMDALQNQLAELLTQLEVFEIMKMRASKRMLMNEANEQLSREIFRLRNRLPILAKRIDIEDLIKHAKDKFFIIQGQTGSGKSTQIAQYLADFDKFEGKRIVCTQPLELSALSLAKRVSYEYSGGDPKAKLGFQVGFHVGGQKVVGQNCRIEFVTESVMLERIVRGSLSEFRDTGCIIIDEAHERSITCDLLLGLLKKDDPRWKDIKIVIISATLVPHTFSSFYKGAPILEIEGRTFPVEIIHHPVHENQNVRNAVVQSALKIHKSCKHGRGDILCFVPCQEDVLSAMLAFEAEVCRLKATEFTYMETKVYALYEKQDPEQHVQVFEKLSKHVRKVIFSTDIAETSVTIDGVVFVVDSGLRKEIIFDPKRNVSSLQINNISKSSAIQRAGRCGRTQPGQCHRLYSEEDFENMCLSTTAEIFRKPLPLAVLTLREMNIEPENFDWINTPSRDAILSAVKELHILKALNEDKTVTDLGRLIAKCQQDPQLVKMIFHGCTEGYGLAAINIASILTVCNTFFWNGMDEKSKAEAKRQRQLLSDPEGDIVTMYKLFQQWLDIREGKTNCSTHERLPVLPKENTKPPNFNPFKFIRDDLSQDDNVGSPAVPRENYNNAKKQAIDFCKLNSLNWKALSCALTTRNELLAIFKPTDVWMQKSQENLPNSQETRRIAFSGYFLQTACLIISSKMNTPQYYSLYSDILASLDFRSALLNHSSEFSLPKWIISNQILRFSTTLFPASLVEESWIKEESPEFYELCISKCESLPTKTLVISLSQECLRTIVGKYCTNLDNLEKELDCSLEVDFDKGQIIACCLPTREAEIQRKIAVKIGNVCETLQKQVIDMEYLGRTRFVIGKGFEAAEVLFPQEFSTLFIKNIPFSCTKQFLWKFLTEIVVNRNDRDILRILEIRQLEGGISAMAKFCSKEDAKLVFEKLAGQMIGENVIQVSPLGVSDKKGVMQADSCRLKLSWATGLSTGKAKISFSSAIQANKFIEIVNSILPGAVVGRVHGELSTTTNIDENSKLKKALPPVIALRGLDRTKCRFRFEITSDTPPEMEYTLTVVNLSFALDEYEIKERLKSIQLFATWIKVRRQEHLLFKDTHRPVKEKLFPLQKYIGDDTKTLEFCSPERCRAGIYIYFSDQSTAQKAYKEARKRYYSLPLVYSQHHQLEMEYIHSTTIHVDLYKFFKEDILKIKLLGKQKGIQVEEISPKNNSQFIILKFNSNYAIHIQDMQEKLEEISTFMKFSCDKIDLLFTWMGRVQMVNLAKKTPLQWNDKNHAIWIYGRSDMQKAAAENLQRVVDSLSSLEVLDQAFVMNKKKIDLRSMADAEKISQMCQKYGLVCHFHGNKLLASGPKAGIQLLQEELTNKQYLLQKSLVQSAGTNDLPDCGLCLCPVENGKFICTSLCSHYFCIECIQPMFELLPPPVPIKCQTCQLPLAINDILKCAPQGTLRRFLEVAAIQFQEARASDVLICPKPGCNQILSNNSALAGEFGGEFIFCDECLTTYCTACSKELQKPVKSHENYPCDSIQKGTSNDVDRHVKEIQEKIFNLSCPRCNTVFFEFDGCAAVTCESCKCAFCGLCLKDCGRDAHEHVRKCPKNPKRNEYFIDKSVLNQVHSEMRVSKLRAYLVNIADHGIRYGIKRLIHKDLIELQMSNIQF